MQRCVTSCMSHAYRIRDHSEHSSHSENISVFIMDRLLQTNSEHNAVVKRLIYDV